MIIVFIIQKEEFAAAEMHSGFQDKDPAPDSPMSRYHRLIAALQVEWVVAAVVLKQWYEKTMTTTGGRDDDGDDDNKIVIVISTQPHQSIALWCQEALILACCVAVG